MGSVWIAEHSGLRTRVVVKFISEALASDPEIAARFSREAAAASLVKSPHVVHMIDYGVLPTGAFIAMELLEGHDLRRRLELDGILPPRQAATLISQVAKALARAHERGVVHRDIKPDNIFLSDGGGGEAFIKVLDFGVAKIDDPKDLSHTRTGDAVGTPFYMSPEQVVGSKAIDHRTDLWSLGVVAIEAMTAKHPFDGETAGALALAICNKPLPVPSAIDASLPMSLDAWFARACGREPAERFGSAKELADAFETAVGGREAIPYAGAASARFGHAPTVQSDKVFAEPTTLPVSPAASSMPGGSTTLGAVSESGPTIPSPRWRVQVIVAAIGVAAIVGALAIHTFSGASARATQPSSAPRPSSDPIGSPEASVATPPVVAPSSAPAIDMHSPSPSLEPSRSVPVMSSLPALPVKRSIAGTRPDASTSSAPADPFGSGRR
jgi:serine/threonine-protein kinase